MKSRTPLSQKNIVKDPVPNTKIQAKFSTYKTAVGPKKNGQVEPQKQPMKAPIKSGQVKKQMKRMPAMGSQIQKMQLFPCPSCGRTFAQEALKKHKNICKKIFINKRKEFNSAKQRIVSKEQVNLLKNNKNEKPLRKEMQKEIPKWKQDSVAFRMAMKQVRGTKMTEQQVQITQAIKETNLTKCKFCLRSFNETAAAKHIPLCQNKAKEQAIKKTPKPSTTFGKR